MCDGPVPALVSAWVDRYHAHAARQGAANLWVLE
jgi:hypothetical protein